MAKKVKNTKRRLTFIDVALILAIIGLVGFVVYSVFNSGKSVSGSKAVEIEYQIKIEKINYENFGITLLQDNKIQSDFLSVGEYVYFENNSKEIGKIVSVEYEPYITSTQEVDEEGNLIFGEYPGYINLVITVKTNAEKTDYGFKVWNEDLLVNTELAFRTRSYCGVGQIVDILEKGGDKE